MIALFFSLSLIYLSCCWFISQVAFVGIGKKKTYLQDNHIMAAVLFSADRIWGSLGLQGVYQRYCGELTGSTRTQPAQGGHCSQGDFVS